MPRITPFRALLPDPLKVKDVSAVPYDVVSREEAQSLAAGNPFSFLRVSRPEIELPAGTHPYTDEVYQLASANFKRLCSAAPLTRRENSEFFIYAVSMGNHTQTGLVAAVDVEDYDMDRIRKHERTRVEKEDDRTRHIQATRAHTGPVFLLHRARPAIDRLISTMVVAPPLFDFCAEDGVRHRVWPVPTEETNSFREAFAALDCFYIADGHHRAKSASRVCALCRAGNPAHRGDEAYNRFLAVLFPDDQLRILAYNRVVRDLCGRSCAEFLEALRGVGTLCADASPAPEQAGNVSVYLDNRWYRLALPAAAATKDPAAGLDVSVLQDRVLGPLLNISDPRTSPRIDFIGGIHGTARLEKLVQSRAYALAFSMYPTTVKQLMAVSDAGANMPPKSTWFEPKLRDGLIIHSF